jgi:hypothetical protein
MLPPGAGAPWQPFLTDNPFLRGYYGLVNTERRNTVSPATCHGFATLYRNGPTRIKIARTIGSAATARSATSRTQPP